MGGNEKEFLRSDDIVSALFFVIAAIFSYALHCGAKRPGPGTQGVVGKKLVQIDGATRQWHIKI